MKYIFHVSVSFVCVYVNFINFVQTGNLLHVHSYSSFCSTFSFVYLFEEFLILYSHYLNMCFSLWLLIWTLLNSVLVTAQPNQNFNIRFCSIWFADRDIVCSRKVLFHVIYTCCFFIYECIWGSLSSPLLYLLLTRTVFLLCSCFWSYTWSN